MKHSLWARGTRLQALDAFRGMAILLMLMQYTMYVLGQGLSLPMSPGAMGLATIATPTISQSYLAIATFLLGLRSSDELRPHYRKKLFAYAALFIAFTFELLLVDIDGYHRDLSQAFEFNAIMCWMSCLAICLTLHVFVPRPYIAIGLALIVAERFFNNGHWGDLVQVKVSEVLGVAINYDVRIEDFIGSAFVGLGVAELYKKWKHEVLFWPLVCLAGLLLFLPWVLWGAPYTPALFDPYSNEFQLARSGVGSLAIWGSILLLFGVFFCIVRDRSLPLVSWCGRSSLLIYATHKLLLGRVGLPLFVELRSVAVNMVRLDLVFLVMTTLVCCGIIAFIQRHIWQQLSPSQ